MDDEAYYFLRMYSIDLNTARQAIKVLRRYRRPDVRYALLRDLTVAYVRPFSTNRGRQQGTHALSVKKHVPKEMKGLHLELVRVRMQQFAHTDLSYYNPIVFSLNGSNGHAIIFKGFDYEALLRKLDQIEELIRAVESSVNAAIADYESESSVLSEAIPAGPEVRRFLEK
jgi:hypothetical protein